MACTLQGGFILLLAYKVIDALAWAKCKTKIYYNTDVMQKDANSHYDFDFLKHTSCSFLKAYELKIRVNTCEYYGKLNAEFFS